MGSDCPRDAARSSYLQVTFTHVVRFGAVGYSQTKRHSEKRNLSGYGQITDNAA